MLQVPKFFIYRLQLVQLNLFLLDLRFRRNDFRLTKRQLHFRLLLLFLLLLQGQLQLCLSLIQLDVDLFFDRLNLDFDILFALLEKLHLRGQRDYIFVQLLQLIRLCLNLFDSGLQFRQLAAEFQQLGRLFLVLHLLLQHLFKLLLLVGKRGLRVLQASAVLLQLVFHGHGDFAVLGCVKQFVEYLLDDLALREGPKRLFLVAKNDIFQDSLRNAQHLRYHPLDLRAVMVD